VAPQPYGVHLRPTEDRGPELPSVVEALAAHGAGRVGLDGVLTDLDRRATAVRAPASGAHWGFRWDHEDSHSARWWPQGVTTSADHAPSETYDGRRLVLTSWYSKDHRGGNIGSRVSVVDLTDRGAPRYRHVLLVDVVRSEDGGMQVRPLRVHAGGIVWHGAHLHVARTARGIAVAHLDDVLHVGDLAFGYRYLLPVRLTYDAVTDEGHERLRYSFLSLARDDGGTRLLAGEYGRRGASTRLAEYAFDPATLLLETDAAGLAHPRSVHPGGVEGMQGVAVVDGRWYLATSAGRFLRGSMHVGEPGALRRRPRVLPVGVEDLSHWPSRDELWTLTEYPGRRCVLAMDRARLG